MASRDTRYLTDLGALKAFGHPLRLRLYRALCVTDSATASQLAEQVDEAVSLVSYHLRKLAAHGLIEETEGPRADGRERWWRRVSEHISIHDTFEDAPEAAAAHAALLRTMAHQQAGMRERFLDERQSWGPDWLRAAFDRESLPRLTPDELRRFGEELRELTDRWETQARAAVEAGDTEGRESVALHLYGFPFRDA
ncbi:ArsR/SmtB family transcription factor [Streptomyces hainanensis]|uniref:ArsR family transcriptional regulator n=1 Tax=Streptomyces hainanensis TaxID=402648 RepID=A0A4R4SCP9_9ACTN|nr:helix-turn-helix domain-containing protein [Streptomyces hainanensis]TDC59592.1 ArsR family transcriptional regulator [Streptomyces hainanensis]